MGQYMNLSDFLKLEEWITLMWNVDRIWYSKEYAKED